MNVATGPLAVLVALAWFGAGAYGVFTFFRHRKYVNSLPPSPGNASMRRWHRLWLIVGLAMLAIGAWNTALVLGL
jgi:hypothetical protein